MTTGFTEADYESAATRLGVEVAAIKAVAEVEASGATFWNIDGKSLPPVRIEAHWFGKLTGYRFNESHPHISSRKWNVALAATTWRGAWKQFEEAAALDYEAAIQACSWGAFQVMGFHWKALDYDGPSAFRDAMDTAGGQLDAFARFIYATPAAHDALQRQDWHAFENAYNGGGFNGAYARKMAAAYERHA